MGRCGWCLGGCGFWMEDPVPQGSLQWIAGFGEHNVRDSLVNDDAEVPGVQGCVAANAQQQPVADIGHPALGEGCDVVDFSAVHGH